MKSILLAVAAVAGLISAPAHAELSTKDLEFFSRAGGAGLYTVEAGRLAQKRGQSDAVKQLGDMLEKDHIAVNIELKALAGQKGTSVPAAIPLDRQKQLDQLTASTNFDRDFIALITMDDPQADVALYESYSTGADDADVKAFASKNLPALKTHRSFAQRLRQPGR